MSVTVRRRVPRFAAGGSPVSLPLVGAGPAPTPLNNSSGGSSAGAIPDDTGGYADYNGGLALQAPSTGGYTPSSTPTAPRSAAPPQSDAFTATAQGLPRASPAGGFAPGPQSNAAGSWGGAADTGIVGDPGQAIPETTGASYQRPGTAGQYATFHATPAPGASGAPAAPSISGFGTVLPGVSAAARGGAIPEHFHGGTVARNYARGGAVHPHKAPSDPGWEESDPEAEFIRDQNKLHAYETAVGSPEFIPGQSHETHLPGDPGYPIKNPDPQTTHQQPKQQPPKPQAISPDASGGIGARNLVGGQTAGSPAPSGSIAKIQPVPPAPTQQQQRDNQIIQDLQRGAGQGQNNENSGMIIPDDQLPTDAFGSAGDSNARSGSTNGGSASDSSASGSDASGGAGGASGMASGGSVPAKWGSVASGGAIGHGAIPDGAPTPKVDHRAKVKAALSHARAKAGIPDQAFQALTGGLLGVSGGSQKFDEGGPVATSDPVDAIDMQDDPAAQAAEDKTEAETDKARQQANLSKAFLGEPMGGYEDGGAIPEKVPDVKPKRKRRQKVK